MLAYDRITYTPIPWTLVPAFYCVGCQVGLAILRFIKRRSNAAGGVQEDGQRFITDWSSQQCIFAEEAFSALLQISLPITILQATTNSAQYHAPQEYSRLGRSLSEEASPPEPRTPSDSSSSPATASR